MLLRTGVVTIIQFFQITGFRANVVQYIYYVANNFYQDIFLSGE